RRIRLHSGLLRAGTSRAPFTGTMPLDPRGSDSLPPRGIVRRPLTSNLFVTQVWHEHVPLTLNDAGNVLVQNNTAGILSGISVTNGFDQYLRRTNLVVL